MNIRNQQIEGLLRSIIKDLYNEQPTNLAEFTEALDSLDNLEFIMAVEQTLGVEFSQEELDYITGYASLIHTISTHLKDG